MTIEAIGKIIENTPHIPFSWKDYDDCSVLEDATHRHLRYEVKIFLNPDTQKWNSAWIRTQPWEEYPKYDAWEIDEWDEDDTREGKKSAVEDCIQDMLYEDIRALVCMNLRFSSDDKKD